MSGLTSNTPGSVSRSSEKFPNTKPFPIWEPINSEEPNSSHNTEVIKISKEKKRLKLAREKHKKESLISENELRQLAEKGEILNIDKAFELFGIGSSYYRKTIVIYSILLLFFDCSWQLVINLDRKIYEARQRVIPPLCTERCKCAKLYEEDFGNTLLHSIGDSNDWGPWYIIGTYACTIFMILTESKGRRYPAIVSMISTALLLLFSISAHNNAFYMKLFTISFGLFSTATNVLVFVNALESVPYKLRPLLAVLLFLGRRATRAFISSVFLIKQNFMYGIILSIILLSLGSAMSYYVMEETAAYLLLHDKIYELEQLFDKILINSDLIPDRSTQQIADELAFREEDVEMTKSDYLSTIFHSRAAIFILNVCLIVSSTSAMEPVISKRYNLMVNYSFSCIDSTFTYYVFSIIATLTMSPIVLFASNNRFRVLTTIELLCGIFFLAAWLFNRGNFDRCNDSLVYSGAWWWCELVLLIISEGLLYSVYMIGAIAMVEVVPTRARTFTTALLYSVATTYAGVVNRIIRAEGNSISRTTLEIPICCLTLLVFSTLSILSYTAPNRMVDYLVDVIPKSTIEEKKKKRKEEEESSVKIRSPRPTFTGMTQNVAVLNNESDADTPFLIVS